MPPFLLMIALLTTSCATMEPAMTTEPARGARVVLVHGIYDTGAIFEQMSKTLRAQGHLVISPSITPNNASVSMEEMAAQLKGHIDQAFGPDAPVHIIAFSMGGLVSREYLEHHGGAARTPTLFTLSSPHHGSQLANLAWGKGMKQMRPGSEFLKRLERDEATLEGMEIRSYWTPYDLMILPATSSVWRRAKVTKVSVALHPWMVKDERIVAEIVAYLDTVRPQG